MRVITKTSELTEICEAFSSDPYVTVDTEFLREQTFFAQLLDFR